MSQALELANSWLAQRSASRTEDARGHPFPTGRAFLPEEALHSTSMEPRAGSASVMAATG